MVHRQEETRGARIVATDIVSVRNLHKSYGNFKALDGLDFAVREGEFFGFLGPNGAGKTTTIRILSGILRPDQGEIEIGGYRQGERREIAGIIGVLPESRGFYDWMTAEEYLTYFAEIYGIPSGKRLSLVERLLSEVRLLSNRRGVVGTFSRGMKQRLALARTLVNSPRLLLLDEPTLGLDPQGQEDIQNLLRVLNGQGVTIFLSSHLLPEVSSMCSTVAIINKGKLVAQGSMSQLTNQNPMEESYRIRIRGAMPALRDGDIAARLTVIRSTPEFSEMSLHGDIAFANKALAELQQNNVAVLEFRAEHDSLTNTFLSLTRE